MYRNSASLNMAVAAMNSRPSPAPNELSECEAELSAELDRKRRQLDDEVARFKAQKDMEFRSFERDLRWKRKRSRSSNAKDTPPPKALPSHTPSALSLLAVGSIPQVNGNFHNKKSSDGLVSPKSQTPSSKPTLSLEKLNINGTTTPPIIGDPHAHSNALTKSLSRSPSNLNIALTPPRSRVLSKPNGPHDRDDTSFAGLFTPAYLPLLDSHSHSHAPPITTPPTRKVSESQVLLLTPAPVAPPSLSTSLPQELPPFLSTHARRALTEPMLLPSASLPSALPSALRTASGTALRKRKKVTFQLSDSAIVEPSSSYEELPKPVLNIDANDRDEFPEEEGLHPDDSEDPPLLPPRVAPEIPLLGFMPVQLDPTKPRKSSADSTASLPDSAVIIDGLGGATAEDGGSGVGFFELDEELGESPVEPNPYEHLEEEEEPGGRDETEVEDENEKAKLGFGSAAVMSGSVPIDIVSRGSGSWFGSYGH